MMEDFIATVQINDGPELPGQLNITQESINVTTVHGSQPDPSWEFIDAAGHFHAYDGEGRLPTLDMRSRHVECDIHDDVECSAGGYNVFEWFCRICDELVEPRRVPNSGQRLIPGLKSWEVTTSSVQEIGGDQATVRFRTNDRTYFGVALVTEQIVLSPRGIQFRVTLIGAGPLGERRG